MKKIFGLLLVTAIVLGAIGCAKPEEGDPAATTTTGAADAPATTTTG